MTERNSEHFRLQYHRTVGTLGQDLVVGVRSLWVPSAGVFRVIFDTYPWYTVAEAVTREEVFFFDFCLRRMTH